jgi:hypothetical protein
MQMRDVDGNMHNLDGTWQAGDEVIYRLERVGFDTYSHYMPSEKRAAIDADGTIATVSLWASAGGGRNILVILPNGSTFRVGVPVGTGTISLEELHLLHATPEPASSPALIDILGGQAAPGSPGAALISYIALGLAAIWRTVLEKLRERVTTSDYDTFAGAVAASSGQTLIVNGVLAVSSNLDVPHDITLRFENGGRLEPATGVTVRIYGPIIAGPGQHIFGGLGTIAGSPMIEAAYPDWFGAEGDGETDDTLAVHAAQLFFPLVRGRPGASYVVTGQRVRHTTLDLHRAGRFRAGGWASATNFTGGYWCGVPVRRSTVFEDMTIVLQMEGIATKKSHAFAFGYPDSSVRLDTCGFRGCTFVLAGDLPDEPQRPHIGIVQSVDHFFVEDCTITGVISLKDLESTNVDTGLPKFRQITRLAGFALYDSHQSSITRNTWHAAQVAAIYEFCEDMAFDQNTMTMCATIVDLDKRDVNFHARHNSLTNDAEPTITETQYIEPMMMGDTDAAFEGNGIDGFELVDNVLENVQRELIANGKPDVYLSFIDDVLTQSQDPARYAFTVCNNVTWANKVHRTWLQAWTVGSSWEDEVTTDPDTGDEITLPSAHNGTMCGTNHYCDSEYTDCALSLGTGEFSAVGLIREARAFRFGPKFLIDGSASEGTGAYGVQGLSAYTISGSPIGATQYSTLEILSFAGTIRNTTYDAFFFTNPEYVKFDGLTVEACGINVGGGHRQMLVYYPERRNATIHGALRATPGALTIAKGLQVRSKTFQTGTWRIDTSQFRILGHDDDLVLDDSVSGSETPSTACFILKPQLPLPIWPPALGSTSASPAWLEVNGGVIIRWVAAHATQGYAQVQLLVPEQLVPDTLTVRCRIRSSVNETTEIRTNRRQHRVGQDLGWDATDVLYDTADLTANWADMTVATLTNLHPGDVIVLAFRPRAVGNGALLQNKTLLSVYVQ